MKPLVKALLVAGLILPGFVMGPHSGGAEKPNVLFLMSDDMRPDLGCYGNDMVKSPNIDALAKSGVRFDRAYVQYPLCNPSRSSLLTGRYPTGSGVLDNNTWFGAVHPELESLPRHFKDNGYVTLRTGKIFHGGIDDAEAWSEGGEKRAFEGKTRPRGPRPDYARNSDRRVVLEGDGESHGDYRTADRAIGYLRKYKDKPFFLACGFTKPHSPPTAPQKFYDLYEAGRIPLPEDFAPRVTIPEGFPPRCLTPSGDLFIRRDASREEAREMIRAYWASISWVDWNLGRVVAELDRLGLREKTVIVFWGDHGYHLGEKGKWSKHGSLFEVGTRVPQMITLPGGRGNGKACRRVVESLDLYATLCDLCGLELPRGVQGKSLRPLLDDPEAMWDRPAFSVFGRAGKVAGLAARTERYRYAEYEDGTAMLFDHESDPHERKNLADSPEHRGVREELHKLLAEWRKREGVAEPRR